MNSYRVVLVDDMQLLTRKTLQEILSIRPLIDLCSKGNDSFCCYLQRSETMNVFYLSVKLFQSPTWLRNVYLLRWMCCSAAFDQHSCSRSVRLSTLHLTYTCRHCQFICFSQLNSSAPFFFTQHIFSKIASFFEECWVSKRGLMCVVFQCDGHR